MSSNSKPTPHELIVSSLDYANKWPRTEVLDARIRYNSNDEAVMLVEGLRTFGYEIVPSATHTVELVAGTIVTLTREGEAVRKAMVEPVRDGALAEAARDDWGLCPRNADDLAARSGCRVEVSGLDNPHLPLTDGEVGDPAYVVVTERATGRLAGLVEAWFSEDGDPLVPRSWLTTVLSAWEARTRPQRAAA